MPYTPDAIRHVKLSTATLAAGRRRSATPRCFTGRQKPMTEVVFLFAEITTEQGHQRHRLQLLQARRRPGPVRPRQGGRRRHDRRGPQRHRQDLHQAALGRRLGGPLRRGHPGPRRHRHRAVRPQGQARRPAAGQAPGRLPRLGPDLQHLRRLPQRLRSTRSRTAPAVRSRRASAASRSRSACPTPPRTCAASPRIREHIGWRRAADGGRQPAVGPRHRPADGPPAGGVRPGLDRGAAGRLRRRGPRRTSPAPWTPPSPPARCWPAWPSTTA